MKKIIILFVVMLLVLPVFCFAESDVTLEWSYQDPNAITGYRLYRAEASGQYDFSNPVLIVTSSDTVMATDSEIPDGIYYWVVKAYKDHIINPGLPPSLVESMPSNEVRADLKTLLPYLPSLSLRKILKIDIVDP